MTKKTFLILLAIVAFLGFGFTGYKYSKENTKYVLVSAPTDGSTAYRVLHAGTGISVTDGGPGGNVTIANTGNASTASALEANGANCSAGQFPLGVDEAGAVESCTALPTTIAGTSNQISASASTGAVTLSIPSSPTLPGTTTLAVATKLTGQASPPVACDSAGHLGQIYYDTSDALCVCTMVSSSQGWAKLVGDGACS